MRTTIIKQIFFSFICLGYGWFLARWCGDTILKPLAYAPFVFAPLLWSVLALVYIGIHKTAIRRLYLGLLISHYVVLAGWVISLGVESIQATRFDPAQVLLLFIWYGIGQIGVWYAFYRGTRKPLKI